MAEDVSVGNLVTNLVGDGDVFLKNIEAAITRIDALNVKVMSVGASIANVNKVAAPAQPMQQQVGAVANVAAHQQVAATHSANAAKSAAVQLTHEQKINQIVQRRIELMEQAKEVAKKLEEQGYGKEPPEDKMEAHIPARLISHIVSHAAESAGIGGIGGQTMLFSHLLEHGLPLAGGVVVGLALAAAVHHVYEEQFRLNEAAITYVEELKKAQNVAMAAGQAVLGNTAFGKEAAASAAEHAQKAEDIASAYAKARREAGATGALMDVLNEEATKAHNAIFGTSGPGTRGAENAQIERQIQDQKDIASIEQSFAQIGFRQHVGQETGDLKGQVEGARIAAMHNGPLRERAALEHKINEEMRDLKWHQVGEHETLDKAHAEETMALDQRGAGQPEKDRVGVRQINENRELDSQHSKQRISLGQKAEYEYVEQQEKEQEALIAHQNAYQQARIEAATSGKGKEIALIHERLSEALDAAQREGQSAQTMALIKAEAAEKEKAIYAGVKDSIADQNIALEAAQHKITDYAATLQKIAIDNQGASQDMIDLLNEQAAVQEKVWGANFARQQMESIHNIAGMKMQLEDYARDLDRAVASGQLQVEQAKELYKYHAFEIGLTKPVDTGKFMSSGGAAGRKADIDYRYINFNHPLSGLPAHQFTPPGGGGSLKKTPTPGTNTFPAWMGHAGIAATPSKDPNTDLLSAMLKLLERIANTGGLN